jgi:hypothetical protein
MACDCAVEVYGVHVVDHVLNQQLTRSEEEQEEEVPEYKAAWGALN